MFGKIFITQLRNFVMLVTPLWTIPVVMLVTVVATTATLSNLCKSTIFYTFYFRSAETVRCDRHVS